MPTRPPSRAPKHHLQGPHKCRRHLQGPGLGHRLAAAIAGPSDQASSAPRGVELPAGPSRTPPRKCSTWSWFQDQAHGYHRGNRRGARGQGRASWEAGSTHTLHRVKALINDTLQSTGEPAQSSATTAAGKSRHGFWVRLIDCVLLKRTRHYKSPPLQ